MAETKDDGSGFPRKPTSGTGNFSAYSVEARYTGEQPKDFAGHLLGQNWRRIEFVKSTIGIPAQSFHTVDLTAIGLHGYAAAQALRWWFLAAVDAQLWSHGLETRLVEHRINYHYDATAECACEIVSGGHMSVIARP